MQTLHNINKGGGEAREGEEPWGLECGRECECGFRRGAWRVGKRTRERREEVSKMTQAIGMEGVGWGVRCCRGGRGRVCVVGLFMFFISQHFNKEHQ